MTTSENPKKLRDQSKGVYLHQEPQRPEIPQLHLKPQLYIKKEHTELNTTQAVPNLFCSGRL